jgi:lipocalin
MHCCPALIFGDSYVEKRIRRLEVVRHVNLQMYLGKWYEAAHLPFRLEDDCSDITATYSLREDGSILQKEWRSETGQRAKQKWLTKTLGET